MKPDESVTGHPLGDAVLPAAQRLVCAVRDGDQREMFTALNEARTAGGMHWMITFACTLAAMVPDDRPVASLLAWCQVERVDPYADEDEDDDEATDEPPDIHRSGRKNIAGLTAYREERDARAAEMLAAGKRKCSTCKEIKSLAEFNRSASNFGGYEYRCRDCLRETRSKTAS
jgi:hypothetical protein